MTEENEKRVRAFYEATVPVAVPFAHVWTVREGTGHGALGDARVARDWAERDTYDVVMDIVKNHVGAHGMGVEYAYTMVRGAPATRLPE